MTDCVLHHLKAIKLQSVWSHTFEAMQDLGSLEGHGQTKDEELLVPLTITKAQTPVSLLKLMSARCLAAGKTALTATQDLLAQQGASAWQKMKHVGNPLV